MPSPIDPLASVAYTITDTLTWETSTDWDNAVDEAGVVHEGFGDLPGAGTVQLGHPSFDRGGSSLNVFLPLDEDSGSTVEDVVTGNTGNLNGPTLGATGLHNTTTIDSDGTDDYIEIPYYSALDIQSGDFSIAVWFKHRSTDRQMILMRSSVPGDSDTNEGYILPIGADGWYDTTNQGELGFAFGDGSNLHQHPTGWVPTTDTWHLVVVAFDQTNGEVRVYGDGSSVYSGSESATPVVNSHPLVLGSHFGNGTSSPDSSFDGNYERIRLYSRALSGTEAKALYDAGTGGNLLTETKSFSTATTPDLQNLDYTLNSESISLDVIGSPGTADEEVVTQALGGATSYSLSWADSHTDFRLKPTLSTTDVTVSPTISRLELA